MGVPSSASLRRLRRLRQHVSGGTPAAATHTDMVTKTNGVFGPCAAADASSTSASPLPSGLDRYIAHSGDRSNEVMLAHTVARALPKTELHLHLDGSITADFICRAAARRGITVPPAAQLPRHIDELRAVSYRARPQSGKTQEAGKNWGIFDWMNQFLQSAWELEEGACTLMESLAADNVRYAEVRFCPELHCAEGLSPDDAVGAVVAGVRRGCARCGGGGGGGGSIRGGVIVCALRSFPAQHSLAMATLAQQWLGRGVVAFDVAGDEHWPLRLHAAALEFCRAQHVPMTVHAGEVMDVTEPGAMLPNLALALECGAQRIGHGFALCQDESGQLVKQAAAAGVTVEVCLPICLNPRFSWYVGPRTGDGVGASPYRAHPIAGWHRAGLSVALSCDNITLSGSRRISSSSQLVHLVIDCGLGWGAAREVLLNGVRAAFLPSHEKQELLGEFEKELDATLDSFGVAPPPSIAE